MKKDKNGVRSYGRWAGSPGGHREDTKCCVEAVWRPGAWQDSQCGRKRGHGFDGMYCKQHARMEEERRARNKELGIHDGPRGAP